MASRLMSRAKPALRASTPFNQSSEAKDEFASINNQPIYWNGLIYKTCDPQKKILDWILKNT